MADFDELIRKGCLILISPKPETGALNLRVGARAWIRGNNGKGGKDNVSVLSQDSIPPEKKLFLYSRRAHECVCVCACALLCFVHFEVGSWIYLDLYIVCIYTRNNCSSKVSGDDMGLGMGLGQWTSSHESIMIQVWSPEPMFKSRVIVACTSNPSTEETETAMRLAGLLACWLDLAHRDSLVHLVRASGKWKTQYRNNKVNNTWKRHPRFSFDLPMHVHMHTHEYVHTQTHSQRKM